MISFAKMLATWAANQTGIAILFIPLYLFDITDNLISAVERFVQQNRYLNGLDELTLRGKAAAEAPIVERCPNPARLDGQIRASWGLPFAVSNLVDIVHLAYQLLLEQLAEHKRHVAGAHVLGELEREVNLRLLPVPQL